MTKRLVTDILDLTGPVAFIQHQYEAGLVYEVVCPWCAETIAKDIKPSPPTFGQLYQDLWQITFHHMHDCDERDATEMAVVTTRRKSS